MNRQHTILVVDDEDTLREVIVQDLKKMGFIVDEANDGDIAIEAVKKKQYDLVLLDIKMPRVDGIEVLKVIQKDSPATKVMMLTALNDLQHALASKEHGAIDFITKPYDYDEILEKIKQVLPLE